MGGIVAAHKLFIIYYLLFNIYYSLFIIYYLLFIEHDQPLYRPLVRSVGRSGSYRSDMNENQLS